MEIGNFVAEWWELIAIVCCSAQMGFILGVALLSMIAVRNRHEP